MTRLMKSRDGFCGKRKTTTSPRRTVRAGIARASGSASGA